MTDRQGYDTYLKIAPESAWGDGTTPSVSVPILSETIKGEMDKKTREGELNASRFNPTPFTGRQWGMGSFSANAYPDLVGYFLLATYGTPTVTNISSGVFDNVFEAGLTVDQSLSLELSKGGANPLMLAGYKINQLSWNQEKEGAGQLLVVTADGGGKFPTEGSSTTFTAPTTTPFCFTEAVLSVASATAYADSVTWNETNGLVQPNHKISAGAEGREPSMTGSFVGDGSFVANFESLDNWDKFRQATDVAMSITYTTTQTIESGYYYTLTVTIPKVRFKNPLPDISSKDLVKENIAFDMFAGTVDASTVPISYKLRCGKDFSA